MDRIDRITPPAQARACTQPHAFHTGDQAAERRTRLVMLITLATMFVEIAAGWWFNSMALLADGWHMSSHAAAIGLSSLAYWAARRYAQDARFAFGTWKIEVLAGFTSALLLLGVAALMVGGSVERLISPQDIHYQEAIAVAVLGLVVNLACALILGHNHAEGDEHGHHHGHHHGQAHAKPARVQAHAHHGHDHDHDHDAGHDHAHHDHDHHDHEHGHAHHHEPVPGERYKQDINLRAAYVHVIADAATSVLAIVALAAGLWLGWSWLDPVMGLLGAALVALWAVGLLRESARGLLDSEMDHPLAEEIRSALAGFNAGAPGSVQVADLHVWRIGRDKYASIIGLVTDDPRVDPMTVKARLAEHGELVHVTVEIIRRSGP
jgi:cation diffusion facilitator family transporter